MNMEINDFFEFYSKLTLSTVQAHAQNIDLKPDRHALYVSDHNKLITGNYEGLEFPIIFKQELGKKFHDILDTGWPSLHLISDRMKNTLEENNITGWQTFPIILQDKKGNEILGYHGFSILGRCGPTNYDRSEIIEKKEVPNGPICQYYKGVSFEKWDGSDFFNPDDTLHVFITKKTADVLRKNKITNVRLVNLADKEMPVDFIKEKLIKDSIHDNKL